MAIRILRRGGPLTSDLQRGAPVRASIGARTGGDNPVFWERRPAAPGADLVFVGVRV